MDKNGQPTNDQNNPISQPDMAAPPIKNAEPINTNGDASPSPNSQIIASGPVVGDTPVVPDRPEKARNVGRALFVFGFFILIIGGIIGVFYFAKIGIFGEKRISTGNHSFAINENNWQVDEVDESDYSITLTSVSDNAMMSITDNPTLSNYQYDDQSAQQALDILGKTTGTKKSFGDVNCMVYDTATSFQGVNISMKSAVCNVSNEFNAVVSTASQDSSILEKYLNEGIEILKTGQK